MYELNPCPFCGGTPELSFSGQKYWDCWKGYIIVKCINCGGASKGAYYSGPAIDIPLEETIGGKKTMQCWNLRKIGVMNINYSDIIKAFDVLDKFKFFGGQRAGRELWFEKPADVQDEDIRHFVDDVNYLEKFIDQQKAEIEKLRQENLELKDGYFQKRYEETEHQELMGLREAWRKSSDQNMDLQLEIEGLQKDLGIWKDIATRETSYVSSAKTEAIKEFAERLKGELTTGSATMRGSVLNIIDSLVKEMMEEQ